TTASGPSIIPQFPWRWLEHSTCARRRAKLPSERLAVCMQWRPARTAIPFPGNRLRTAAYFEDLGHLDRQCVELPRIGRRLGEPDILVRPRGRRIDRHAHLVIADVVDSVKHLDLPLGGTLHLLA